MTVDTHSEGEATIRSESKVFKRLLVWFSLCSFVLGGTATAAGWCYEQTFLIICGIVVMGPVTCVLLFILLVVNKYLLADIDLPEKSTAESVTCEPPPPGYDDCIREQVIVNVVENDDTSVLNNGSTIATNGDTSLTTAVHIGTISEIDLAKQVPQMFCNTAAKNERTSICSCKSDESNPPSYNFVVRNQNVV